MQLYNKKKSEGLVFTDSYLETKKASDDLVDELSVLVSSASDLIFEIDSMSSSDSQLIEAVFSELKNGTNSLTHSYLLTHSLLLTHSVTHSLTNSLTL